MLKRNLLLGLMVFMVGILITACGDKNSTSNTTTNNANDLPKSFEDNSCDNCVRTYRGRFTILDEDLYLDAFDRGSGFNFDNEFNLFPGDNIISDSINAGLNEGLNNGLSAASGIIACTLSDGITRFFAEIGNYDTVSTDCESVGTTYLDDFNGSDELNSSYRATLRVLYEDGRAEEVELTIEDVLGRDDREVFYLDRRNLFISNDNNMQLTNSNGRVLVGVPGARVFGQFRD